MFKIFFPNTRCKISNEMRSFIYKLLNPKPGLISKFFGGNKTLKVTSLLYSGHFHGWNLHNFHSRCESKGRTVSLFQIEQGDCIGGYTSEHWETLTGVHKADSSAFLFNLTRSRHFPSKATGKDIFCGYLRGPSFFGGYYQELSAFYEPFNGKTNCSSWANQPGYRIPLLDGKNQLTNQENGHFTISELEVWLVEEE